MLQIFVAKVVIFFEICNKLGGNLVFFNFPPSWFIQSDNLWVVINSTQKYQSVYQYL